MTVAPLAFRVRPRAVEVSLAPAITAVATVLLSTEPPPAIAMMTWLPSAVAAILTATREDSTPVIFTIVDLISIGSKAAVTSTVMTTVVPVSMAFVGAPVGGGPLIWSVVGLWVIIMLVG